MARRDYRIISLGDADTWADPVAEQIERTEAPVAVKCPGCGITVLPPSDANTEYCSNCAKRPVGRRGHDSR